MPPVLALVEAFHAQNGTHVIGTRVALDNRLIVDRVSADAPGRRFAYFREGLLRGIGDVRS